MRHLVRLFVLLAALCALPAVAADRAILILDASGSMWAQIDGKARIEIARDALKQVLDGVSPELELGFMAYGHRTKGDCADIEMLVEPAPATAAAIAEAAAGLSPKGKTPLTDAVRQAAEALKYTEDKATVVLITDGIETCDADPCALASELEQNGIDFTVNVVGFGLSEADGAKVKCLADNTNGVYLGADDEQGLKDAITEVVTVAPPSPAPVEPTPPPAPVEPASDITFAPTAILTEGADPLLEGEGTTAWEFYAVNADGSRGDWVRTEYGNTYQGAIEPGDYIVVAKLDYATSEQKLSIVAGEVARPEFDLEAGFIDIRPLDSEGADPNGSAAVYTEFPDGTSTTSYGEVKLYVPAGTTKLKVTYGNAVAEDEVTVAAGESVTKDIVVAVGHASISASYGPGQPVADSNLFVDIFKAKKDIQGNRTEVTSGYGPVVEIDVPPGDYVAVARYDAAQVEQAFTVKAGEATAFDINLNAGVLAITAPGAYSIEVQQAKKDLQGNRVSISTDYDVMATRTLTAGDYHVVVSYDGGKTPKEADASVKLGERTEITIE